LKALSGLDQPKFLCVDENAAIIVMHGVWTRMVVVVVVVVVVVIGKAHVMIGRIGRWIKVWLGKLGQVEGSRQHKLLGKGRVVLSGRGYRRDLRACLWTGRP